MEHVYVVIGREARYINDRVRRLLTLRMPGVALTLVCRPSQEVVPGHLTVAPTPNPFAVLTKVGLHHLQSMLEPFLLFPSAKVLYARRVGRVLLEKAQSALAAGHGVTIITCMPPHDLTCAGRYLKKRAPRVRWIADWQDLWSYDDNYLRRVPAMYRTRLRRWEAAAFAEADLHIVTNERARALLLERHAVEDSRCLAIEHPYDRETIEPFGEFQRPVYDDSAQPIRIGFLGTLFKPPRVPGEAIVEAVMALSKRGLPVELHVFGSSSPSATKMAQRYPGRLILHQKTTHEKALRNIRSCDFLLLALADLPNSRVVLSIKLPHYLATGIPILAIVPKESANADVINASGAGIVIASNSSWTDGLEGAIRAWRRERPSRNQRAIEKFDWQSLQKKWRAAIGSTNASASAGLEGALDAS